MKCHKCGQDHDKSHAHFKVMNTLSDKGFPTHSKKYHSAHELANKKEKEKFGKKAFKEVEKIDRKLGNHELAGKNTRSGKIEVSKKIPEKYRNEVAYHEKIENKALRKKK